jgi:hypothetical protein
MKTKSSRRTIRGVELAWSHQGALHRVSAWPEVEFTCQVGTERVSYTPDPSADSFASAAGMIERSTWSYFLEFLPARERDFVSQFRIGRLAALTVITRCPALLEDLIALPALLPFVAGHVTLRGADAARWDEINAVYGRGGLFSLLEWLGLPASKQTLSILGKITDPDLPRRLLEPVRAAFWEPEMIWLLQSSPRLSEQDLAVRCHALAA